MEYPLLLLQQPTSWLRVTLDRTVQRVKTLLQSVGVTKLKIIVAFFQSELHKGFLDLGESFRPPKRLLLLHAPALDILQFNRAGNGCCCCC